MRNGRTRRDGRASPARSRPQPDPVGGTVAAAICPRSRCLA
ncbi:hypothetical protein RC1_4079 [Rhodospirillum centenum SW]|uniref:Uncharacterized protein n=1 Tax=Rhodospirillum centenum (strain ATCC 51521 / SW) TaxID=414684 RepID=B6IYP4_RHOCS|nr:hypothetical protein RC1_4079 [Rhodospirillum centenum SW]